MNSLDLNYLLTKENISLETVDSVFYVLSWEAGTAEMLLSNFVMLWAQRKKNPFCGGWIIS